MSGKILEYDAKTIRNQGYKEGYKVGYEEGYEEVHIVLAGIVDILLNENRMDDLKLAVRDKEYARKLYEEFNQTK